jgi:thiol-disulfide isomerase/thioredoxin
MKTSRLLVSLLIYLHFCSCVFAQENRTEDFPVVGRRCPDFVLDDLGFFPEKQVRLNDFKHKWLILDFFSTGCEICFARMPKIDRIQKKFSGKLQILMVGKKDPRIRPSFEKYRQHYQLSLSVAYDSALFSRFLVFQVPYAIWIDDQGIVRAITNDIDSDQIPDFLSGRRMNQPLALNAQQEEDRGNYYDESKPLLIRHNGGEDSNFLFRSLLTGWDPGRGIHFTNYISSRSRNRLQVTGVPLYFLYNLAFADTLQIGYPPIIGDRDSVNNAYGLWKILPVLEISDSSIFRYDERTGKNLFSYSLIVPKDKGNPLFLQQVMRRDLATYFGYSVRVEKRMEPYYKITATAEGKKLLQTKGGHQYMDCSFIRFEIVNLPLANLVSMLAGYCHLDIFCDETGINGNVDLSYDAVMTDLADVERALREKGLVLERGMKEMNVVVIRDPEFSFSGSTNNPL